MLSTKAGKMVSTEVQSDMQTKLNLITGHTIRDKNFKFTPGTHIPVYSPEKIDKSKPNYMLILAGNFTDELMKQQLKFKEMGGKVYYTGFWDTGDIR